MGRILVVPPAVLLLLALMAGPVLAQPPPHDHRLTVPGTEGQVQVGPPRCDLGATVQDGFVNFHVKVHVGPPATTGGLTITPVLCP